MPLAEPTLPGALKLFSDPTRLRIIALLEREELSVGELSRALAMAQSRVSNHLRLLRDAELLLERHEGVSTFVRIAGNGSGAVSRLWDALKGDVSALPEHAADVKRLEGVLRSRRARDGEFFDRVAGEWDKIAGEFKTGQARQRMVAHLLPREFIVADLGCGTGFVAEALLGHCSRLICVDRSAGMLKEARKRLLRSGSAMQIELRKGELGALPIADGEVDGAVAGMVLHHLPKVDDAVAEMFRILKPGGSAVVLELSPHRETWMRQELGDRHLGLEPSDVLSAFRRHGFADVVLDPVDDEFQPRRPDAQGVALSLYIVRGRKPAARPIETQTTFVPNARRKHS